MKKLEVDFHTHSIFSECGVHTVLEMLMHAKKIGLKALAITDHGKALPECRLNSPFFLRLDNPIKGIILIKGAELNVINESGDTDCPSRFLPFMDIVLLGLHHNLKRDLGEDYYTTILINAIKKNKFVDIITHPNNPDYPVDLEKLIRTAKEADVAIEINNSKIEQKKVSEESVYLILELCKKYQCKIAVNSDAHVLNEIGKIDSVLPFLNKTSFPLELIINRNLKTALKFIEERKIFKKN